MESFLGPGYLLFLPTLFFLRWTLPKKCLMACFLVYWFLGTCLTSQMRLHLPILAILACLLGLSAASPSLPQKKQAFGLALLILVWGSNISWAARMFLPMGEWSVVAGQVTRDESFFAVYWWGHQGPVAAPNARQRPPVHRLRLRKGIGSSTCRDGVPGKQSHGRPWDMTARWTRTRQAVSALEGARPVVAGVMMDDYVESCSPQRGRPSGRPTSNPSRRRRL